jgi:hypothetical protein
MRNVFDSNTSIFATSCTSLVVSERNDGINEFSEIVSDRKIYQNILEENNKIFGGEAAHTLKSLKFS